MIEKIATIRNQSGIHARSSEALIDVAKRFDSDIVIKFGEEKANGKSFHSVYQLGAGYGEKITVIADGEDEELAVQAIIELIDNKFGELY